MLIFNNCTLYKKGLLNLIRAEKIRANTFYILKIKKKKKKKKKTDLTYINLLFDQLMCFILMLALQGNGILNDC